MKDCLFRGFESSNVIIEEESINEEILNDFCPNNPSYFSYVENALVYIYIGRLVSEFDTFEHTGIGAIKLENADV
jgi:hypothetical protein